MTTKMTTEDERIHAKIEAWQGMMNRLDTSGEVIRFLHDDVDCAVPPDASEYVKRRAEEIKAKMVLLAEEVDWLLDACEVPGLAEDADPAKRR